MKINNIENKPTQIDIEKVFAEKNPRLIKVLPKFIFKIIKKIIHQDDINENLLKYHHLQGLDFVHAVLQNMKIKYNIIGEENIPTSGRNTFAANHPLGGLDGLVLIDAIGKHFNDIRFIVNDVLMNLKNFAPIFVPVNKFGSNTKEYAELIEQTYKSDSQILYFPAGLVSRKIGGKITDLAWQKTFVSKSWKNQRNIVPVYIDGKNSNLFYNINVWRRFLGIQLNIEMFLLPHEMFSQKNKTITLIIGKTIPYQMLDKSVPNIEWAARIKKYVYALGNGEIKSFAEWLSIQ